MTKENLIKIINNNFKPKDVGVGIYHCISEKKQVENLANELLEAINYTRCFTEFETVGLDPEIAKSLNNFCNKQGEKKPTKKRF